MLIIPGQPGKDVCDRRSGLTRRDLLRVGGSGLLGLSLGQLLELQADGRHAATAPERVEPGWGKAKSIIMVYLQGGPSHLDLWDPKENVPDNVRSAFKPIATKIPGIQFTEILPRLAQINDKFTMIRSMSYTPNGLFNHTAAIYQMMTGYTTDKVSPSGQLEPPSPKDFPNFGSQLIRLQPLTEPMLPFVMLPRPLQESNVVGKGGTAGFLGKAYDPYTLYPDGDDMDMDKMDRIKIDDLQLRPEVFATRLERRAKLREADRRRHAGDRQGRRRFQARIRITNGRSTWSSRAVPARRSTSKPSRPPCARLYGRNTFGQSCLLARRLVEAGTRVVEVIWPKVANSDNHSWDHHVDLTKRMKNQSGPMLDAGLSGLITDMDERGMLEGHAGRGGGRVRPQPAEGRQHLGQRQQRRRPRSLALLLHGRRGRCRHQARLRPRPVRQDRLRRRWKIPSIRASCWPRSITPSASIRTRSSTTT